MSTPTKHEEWQQDAAAAADPAVLPEYTVLPSSPSIASLPEGRVPTAPDLPLAEANAPRASSPSSTSSSSSHNHDHEHHDHDHGHRKHHPSEIRRILRMLTRGLLALVLPPVLIAGGALAAAAAMFYGCGKLLEGLGRGLAAGPEALYRVCGGKKARAAWRAVRGRKARSGDAETGAIAI